MDEVEDYTGSGTAGGAVGGKGAGGAAGVGSPSTWSSGSQSSQLGRFQFHPAEQGHRGRYDDRAG